jgi:hypothetical protein
MPSAIEQCRAEVDRRIDELSETVEKGLWTEERAKKIAEQAADQAVRQITENFYMGVGRRTVAIIGALVVGLALWLHELWWPGKR